MEYTCPICAPGNAARAFEKFDIEMAECRDCGLVYTVHEPTNTAQRYSPDWFEREYLPSFGIDPKNPKTDHLAPRFDRDLELIERYVPRGRLLDVGAGAGLLLERARQRGWDVAGVEPAPYGVAFARATFGIDIFQGLLADTPFASGSFDAISLQDVIEHVGDPGQVLQQAHRLLRSGGIIFITTPNYQSISRMVYRRNWALISPAEHLSLFRPKTARHVLKRSGFDVPFLTTTSEIAPGRYHSPQQRLLSARKKFLQGLERILPPQLVTALSVGDELIGIAQKQPG